MFVALTPPDEALDDLGKFLLPRQEADSGFRWTAPEQWHVTLAFMPHVAERHLDDLVARLAQAGVRRTPFSVALAGGGAFPDPGKAKVLYAGLDLCDSREELNRLATGARAAASKSGAETGGGRFHPHVTLARLGRPTEATRWVRVLDSYRGPPWAVTDFALIESHLGEGPRRRPRYEVVDSFPMGRTGA